MDLDLLVFYVKMSVMTIKNSVFPLVVIALGLSLFYCSQQKQESEKPLSDEYQDWKTFTYKNVKIIYPPGHQLIDSFHDMAKGYLDALERNCRFLEIDVPQETLVVYYYTGFRQGREMTGREYPFADKDAIHFWLPSFYGPSLMQYILPRWHNVEPKYQFLKHGLIALFDYSGQNWHQATQGYLDNGKFIPLKELAVDMTVNSDTERHQSALGASFVDFLVYYFGIDGLNLLYRAQAPFETAVQGIFMMPVDSLEGLWLDFVKEYVATMDTTQVNK